MRTFTLDSIWQKKAAMAYIDKAPEDFEVIIRPRQKTRSLEQNKLLWALYTDLSENIQFNGKSYSPIIWHEQCKKDFLPERKSELTTCSYEKYRYLLDGSRQVIGSTKELTSLGFSHYIEQIHLLGATYGISFSHHH